MGILAKSLSPVSAYSAKKTSLWDDITDQIEGALLPAQLDEIEASMAARPLEIPAAWNEPITELIEKKRAALAEEDISAVVRSRFDFT